MLIGAGAGVYSAVKLEYYNEPIFREKEENEEELSGLEKVGQFLGTTAAAAVAGVIGVAGFLLYCGIKAKEDERCHHNHFHF